MAYTRIHAIKSTVAKAVAYICNPEKTEQQLLVDSFGCHPDTAKHDFDYALSRTKSSDKNLAYHLIQSYAKGEVSHKEAHRIGIELADKLLGGKYSYSPAPPAGTRPTQDTFPHLISPIKKGTGLPIPLRFLYISILCHCATALPNSYTTY
ncbi:MAG: relaxase/mobilization nuclease domain-containing protein [Lachnospiraceae bacterium]|nr:relaxase/mobilization nuclease domain-containing protein [Lachnospiraceae bacterium]